MSDDGGPRSGFVRFVGVALGGGRGKTTAVARLQRSPGPPRMRVALVEARARRGHRGVGRDPDGEVAAGDETRFSDDVLIRYLGRTVDDTTVVAIDAPLTLPPCLRCDRPCPTVARCTVPEVVWMRSHAALLSGDDGRAPRIVPYTQRACDVLSIGAGLLPRASLGQGLGPLGARAVHLRRVLSPRLRLHENLLEVDARATVARWFGDRAAQRASRGDALAVWEARKRMLAEMADELEFHWVWPETVVRSVHVFHAVVCAATAYAWARDHCKGPLEPSEGVHRPELAAAVDTYGELWLRDGWVFVPRRRHPRASAP